VFIDSLRVMRFRPVFKSVYQFIKKNVI